MWVRICIMLSIGRSPHSYHSVNLAVIPTQTMPLSPQSPDISCLSRGDRPIAMKLAPFLRRITHVGKQLFSQKLFEGTKEKVQPGLEHLNKTPEWREAPSGPHICCCFFLLQRFPVHRVDWLSPTEPINQDHVTRTETRRQTQKFTDIRVAMSQDQLEIPAGKSPPEPNFCLKLPPRHWLMS